MICVDAQPGADAVRYFDTEWLDADVTLGQWACAHVRTHIDMMDQNLCYRFKLQRERWRPRPISRQLGSLPVPRKLLASASSGYAATSNFPQIPTVVPARPSSQVDPAKTESPAPRRLLARSTPEESQCEMAWHSLKDSIFTFIKQYVQEAGVSVTGQYGGVVGNWARSVHGMEMTLEYDMAPAEVNPFSATDRICIRLRERNLVPYVTIWSRRCPMSDFVTPMLNSEIENYLRALIDKVVTQNG